MNDGGTVLAVILVALLVFAFASEMATVSKAENELNRLGSDILGMPTWMVRQSLGNPTKVATRSTPYGPQEVWLYGSGILGACYVAFSDGRAVEAACR